jgi:hypothetical protein
MERSHRSYTIAEPDFDVRRLQVGDGGAAGVQGDEVDGRTGRTFARDLRLVRRDAIQRICGESRECPESNDEGDRCAAW